MLLAYPLPIGNAVRLLGSLPAGALEWRILRKTVNTFSGPADPNASLVSAGGKYPKIYAVDSTVLTNGTTYYYLLYSFNGTTWAADPAPTMAVPAWNLDDQSTDPLTLVRDRLEDGLRNLVQRGVLVHQRGAIPVHNAPPLFDESIFPVVTVHCTQDGSAERAIGEQIADDGGDASDALWAESEGWLSRWELAIIIWSMNPDARCAIRKAVKQIIIGNLPVFNAAGMVQIDLTLADQEDFESYDAPLYQTMGRLTCMAPSVVVTTLTPIRDVVLLVNSED